MGLRDISLNISYKSIGLQNRISDDFLNPCLKNSKLYQRSVGYFSSSAFSSIKEGIKEFSKNNGKIQLITTPMLSKDDIDAINVGLQLKKDICEQSFEKKFVEEIENLNDENLILLATLIVNDILDIRIVTTKSNGEYHDKLGIFTDCDDNKVVFFGSSNSSNNGYSDNYEKIRVVKVWNEAEKEYVKDELNEFKSIWENTNEFVDVYDFTAATKHNILRVIENRGLKLAKKHNEAESPVKLRDYQIEAINAWKNNNYNGFFVMATGTGKTFTAIYGLKELVKTEERLIVIIAPYKHLIKQWCFDLEKVFPDSKIIMAFSENINWDDQIKTEVIKLRYGKTKQLIIVSTIQSFQMDRFENSLQKLKMERVLVVDEAHRFTTRNDDLHLKYSSMLGLSATPSNGKNNEESKKLVDFFGGIVFSLTIEDALDKGYLVPYNYYPIFVNASIDDEEQFANISHQMGSCFKDGKLIDKDKLLRLSRSRLRLISNNEEKINSIPNILDRYIFSKDHFVVYCGDGKLFQDEIEEDRYINYVKKVLNDKGYKASQFTSSENMKERMKLVDLFDKGAIDSLVAIKCLDEGINIPSIKTALIMSSNDDLKEFVQRRGRILRKYLNKEHADIYDIVVTSSTSVPGLAKIELRRMYEYARLSRNYEKDTKNKINELLSLYNIKLEEILINDDMFEEDYGDE